MKKNVRDWTINKSKTIWIKNQRKFDLDFLSQMREKAEIPKDGFKNEIELEKYRKKWQRKLKSIDSNSLSEKQAGDIPIIQCYSYVRSIKKNFPEIGNGFDGIIEDYFYFDNIPEYRFAISNPTFCDIFWVNENTRMDLEDGLYIRVGEFSTKTDVKNFVESISEKMFNFRKSYIYGENYVKKRVRKYNFELEYYVNTLKKWNKVELKKLCHDIYGDKSLKCITSEKDILIKNILDYMGHKASAGYIKNLRYKKDN